jgi:WD40 repeat protein
MGLLLSSGVHVRELLANAPVVCVAFAGQNLYPVLGDGRLCVWTFESQQPPRCSEAIAEPVSSTGFSGDVRRVLIGCRYGTLLLWDTEKSAEIRKLTGVQSDVGAVAISPGGDRALSGGADKTLRLWNLDTGGETASALAPGDPVTGSQNAVSRTSNRGPLDRSPIPSPP